MDDKLAISYEEIVQEIGNMEPTILQLAIERVKNRKLSEALAAATSTDIETVTEDDHEE